MHADRVTAARRGLPEEKILREVAAAFRLLSDPSQLRIVLALQVRDMCACDLSALLGLPVSETHRHLRRLRARKAVAFRRDDKSVYFSLAGPSLARLVAKAISEAEERRSKPGDRREAGI